MSNFAKGLGIVGCTGLGAYATLCYLEGQEKINQRLHIAKSNVKRCSDKLYDKVDQYMTASDNQSSSSNKEDTNH